MYTLCRSPGRYPGAHYEEGVAVQAQPGAAHGARRVVYVSSVWVVVAARGISPQSVMAV